MHEHQADARGPEEPLKACEANAIGNSITYNKDNSPLRKLILHVDLFQIKGSVTPEWIRFYTHWAQTSS
jgi:hypothetical protein